MARFFLRLGVSEKYYRQLKVFPMSLYTYGRIAAHHIIIFLKATNILLQGSWWGKVVGGSHGLAGQLEIVLWGKQAVRGHLIKVAFVLHSRGSVEGRRWIREANGMAYIRI